MLLHDSREEMTLWSGGEDTDIIAGMHTLIFGYIAGEDEIITTNLIGKINTVSIFIQIVLGTRSVVKHRILHSILIGIMMIKSQNRCTTSRVAGNGKRVSVIRCDHNQSVFDVSDAACLLDCLLELKGFVQCIARLGVMVTIVDKTTWSSRS